MLFRRWGEGGIAELEDALEGVEAGAKGVEVGAEGGEVGIVRHARVHRGRGAPRRASCAWPAGVADLSFRLWTKNTSRG